MKNDGCSDVDKGEGGAAAAAMQCKWQQLLHGKEPVQNGLEEKG